MEITIFENRMETNAIQERLSLIVDCLHPLLFMEKCFGTFRFCQVRGSLNPPTFMTKAYAMALLIVICISYVAALCVSQSPYGIDGIKFELPNAAPVLLVVIQFVISMLVPFMFSKENVIIVKSLAQIDHLLDVDEKLYSKSKRRILVKLIIFSIILILSMVYEFYNQDILSVTVPFTSLIKYGEKLRIFSFYVYISLITERINILNKYIMSISVIGCSKVNESSIFVIRPKVAKTIEIKSLSKSFYLIGNTLLLVNSVFEV
ncbi:uncharacterized protein LOC123689454 [Pieris rapae]|uniref:uncharacterized protein LOC123689454 n=1 Tax=Pieris rapae TaxID=64459 RepID=UPI001E2802AA|nr:uncharacterized protein LOC123689454 [Pieris rapae]